MYKPEQKICPRCHAGFECKADAIQLCQCNTVVLSEAERKSISEKYTDCLCAACLKEIKSEFTND